MADLDIRLILRAYDHLCPLFLGDVPTPGIKLAIDHRSPLTVTFSDSVDIAEVSFNRYVVGRARGDDSLIGLPAFILRGFRHRNFFVLANSPVTRFAEMRGLRVGTNSWPDTGTMWARAAMRDAGVDVGDVQWVIGTLDAGTPNKPPSTSDAKPPAGAEYLTGSDNLLSALREGRIDVLTTAFAPNEVFQPNGWIRRMARNYRELELDYRKRTGVYPGFHIIAARRKFAQDNPQAIVTLYKALQQSFEIWVTKAKKFAEATPWAMCDLETMLIDFAADTPPFGVESAAHQRMIATICSEQYAQKLVDVAANPDELFADFAALQDRCS
jgi:4,5-dihydroxyphthalate decarboxylase